MNEPKDDIRKRRQKEFDDKESTPLPEEFKSDAEKLLDCRERIIVLEDLLVYYSASFNKVRELKKENQDLCDRLNLCGG